MGRQMVGNKFIEVESNDRLKLNGTEKLPIPKRPTQAQKEELMQSEYRNDSPPPTVQIIKDINEAQQAIQQGLPPVMPQQVTTTADIPADSQTEATRRSHEQQIAEVREFVEILSEARTVAQQPTPAVTRSVIPAPPAPSQALMTEDDESEGDDMQVMRRSRISATQRLGKHPRTDRSHPTGARRKIPRRDPYLADPDRQLEEPMTQYWRGRSLERPGNTGATNRRRSRSTRGRTEAQASTSRADSSQLFPIMDESFTEEELLVDPD